MRRSSTTAMHRASRVMVRWRARSVSSRHWLLGPCWQSQHLGHLAVRARRNDDDRERCRLLRVHRKDRHRRLRRARQVPERKDEEVQALLLPGIDRLRVGNARADRPIFGRFLERHEQREVGTGQIVGWRVLRGYLVV